MILVFKVELEFTFHCKESEQVWIDWKNADLEQWKFEHFFLSSPIRATLWKNFMYGQDSNLIFHKDTVMIIMSGYIMLLQL